MGRLPAALLVKECCTGEPAEVRIMHAVLRVVIGDHEAIRRRVMSDDSVLAAG